MYPNNTDIPVEIQLFDSNDDPLSWNILNDYEVCVYQKCGTSKDLLGIFKKGGIGEIAVTVDGTETSKAVVVINRNTTQLAPNKLLYAEVFIQVSAGSNYISSLANASVTDIELTPVVKSANRNSFR